MKWYLLQAKPRQDHIAEANLSRQQYECYRPMCRVEKKISGKLVVREESLFPGYMFVHLSEQDNWSPIRSTLGVKCLVRFGECPVPLPDMVVMQLKSRERIPQNIMPMFDAGAVVQIMEGVFAGMNAVYECKNGEERVVVLLKVLQQQQRLQLPAAAIAAL